MATADFTMVLNAIRLVAERGDEFTTDDVWWQLDRVPLERNVVGKAFAEANRLGIIHGTERFVQSRRSESKGRRVQVWCAVTESQRLF